MKIYVIAWYFKEETHLHQKYLMWQTLSALGLFPNLLLSRRDGVILFRPKQLQNIFEPNQLKYEGKESKAAIESWLTENMWVDMMQRFV